MATAVKDKVNPLLEHLAVPIRSVEPYPNNPRRGDIPLIRESLRANGQYKAIIVQRSSNFIIAGNNTWQAAVEEGWTVLAVQFVDVDDTAAMKILLADNKTGDSGDYDEDALGAMLSQVLDTVGLEGTGWSADSVDDYLAAMGDIATTPFQPFEGDFADTGGESPYAPDYERPADAAPSLVGNLREVVIMVKTDDYGDFMRRIQGLMKSYSLSSVTETVQEAVRRQASSHYVE